MQLLKRVALCFPLVALVAIVLGLPTVAFGDDDNRTFSAHFLGVNETPSISTDATASLKIKINGSGDTATIDYTLTYSGLRADATQSHIHFGQSRVPGGIMVFLCANVASAAGAPTPPACPLRSGTVSGTLKASDVVGPAGQGIASGQMGRVVRAIRDGASYGNLHSTMFPAGETRGQLRPTEN
jgi:hypothetical protein